MPSESILRYDKEISPYTKTPAEAFKDPAVRAAAATVLEYAENKRGSMNNLDGVYKDSGKEVTVQQAVNSALLSSKMAIDTASNARVERLIYGSAGVYKFMDGMLDLSSIKDIPKMITKILTEFKDNMELISGESGEQSPESATGGGSEEQEEKSEWEMILDMFILYGDVADDLLLYLATLLEDNEGFVSYLGCFLLNLFGVNIDAGLETLSGVFDAVSTGAGALETLVKVIKQITGFLVGLFSFFDDIIASILTALKEAIMGIITYLIDALFGMISDVLEKLTSFSISDLLNTIAASLSTSDQLQDPRYIQSMVKASVTGVLKGGFDWTAYIDENWQSISGSVKLDDIYYPPNYKNLTEIFPFADVLKSSIIATVTSIVNTIMSLITKMFSLIAGAFKGEPPTLLVKVDKAVGILGNLLEAIKRLTASFSGIADAVADCTNPTGKDALQTLLDTLLRSNQELQVNIDAAFPQIDAPLLMGMDYIEYLSDSYLVAGEEKMKAVISYMKGFDDTRIASIVGAAKSMPNMSSDIEKYVSYKKGFIL